jgi:hypothetical protein
VAAIEGWPLQRLTEPPLKVRAEPAWDAFPEGLRRDLDDYFTRLAKPHRTLNGKRIPPCSPGTIRTRLAELVAMARLAVRQLGVPIESLTSLATLLHPDVVERVIDAYWRRTASNRKPAPSTWQESAANGPRDRLLTKPLLTVDDIRSRWNIAERV